jgi:hypothetical protein
MAQAPKKRAKRAPEPLDWKELASGPALRGLSEVLATPAEAAKERAARRLAMDGGDGFPAPTPVVEVVVERVGVFGVSETPTVGGKTTAGENPSVGVGAGEVGIVGVSGEGAGEVAQIVETPTVGVLPSVGDIVGPVESGGETPTVDDLPGVGLPEMVTATGVAPTVGVSPPDAFDLPQVVELEGETEFNEAGAGLVAGDSTTVPEAPTVGVSGPADGVVAWKLPTASEFARGSETPTVGYSRTGGVSEWVDAQGSIHVSRKVMRVQIAPHCLTLGEERFYQEVWHAKESEGVRRDSPRSKVFSMGYDRLAKLVRLDEKSVRQLIPKLIGKRVLEVLAGEDSSARIGRTYRIFNHEEILERQRAENMLYVIKKGRAVEFVWPVGEGSGVRVRRATAGGGSPTDPLSPTVGDLYHHDIAALVPPQPPPAGYSAVEGEAAPVEQALNHYVRADGEAVRMIVAGARRHAPNATIEEIVYFIHDKGRLARAGKITNALAYLLVYVPKCFEGEGLRRFREEVRRSREAEEEAAHQARQELAQLRSQWQAWLSDPTVREEDKLWARKMLAGN